MMKKFLLGFATGLAIMHFYLERKDEVAEDATEWVDKAASNYRNDDMKKAVDGLEH